MAITRPRKTKKGTKPTLILGIQDEVTVAGRKPKDPVLLGDYALARMLY